MRHIPKFNELELTEHNAKMGDIYEYNRQLNAFRVTIKDNKVFYWHGNNYDLTPAKCIKNINNKYKIYSYRTMGAHPESIYYVLDIANQKLLYDSCDVNSLNNLVDWYEYIVEGGTFENAQEENKIEFNPAEGI